MTIDPDVARVSAEFNIDPALIQAVVTAERNIVRAVQCTYPEVTDRERAIRIVCRSAVHALSDYAKAQAASEFTAFWGARWAPVGAKNDPKNLNKNWPGNVLKGWTGL